MNKRSDNITTMFETVHAAFQTHHDLWAKSPAFVDLVSRLGTGISVIRQRQSEQTGTGHAQEKQNARDTIERLLLKITSQLSALAAKNNDPILDKKVSTDKSRLHVMAASEFLTFAKSVLTEAQANTKVLVSDYLVPETDFTTLENAIAAYDSIKDAPRLAQTAQRTATLSLPAAIDYVRGLLRNEADKMMEIFRESQPDFYVSYFAARVIVDRAATRNTKTTSAAAAQTAATTSEPTKPAA